MPSGSDLEGMKLLKKWLNKSMKIQMADGRVLIGIFVCTDQDCNVILGSCHEYLSAPESCSEGEKEEPRVLGLAMVPGHHIVSIHIDESPKEDQPLLNKVDKVQNTDQDSGKDKSQETCVQDTQTQDTQTQDTKCAVEDSQGLDAQPTQGTPLAANEETKIDCSCDAKTDREDAIPVSKDASDTAKSSPKIPAATATDSEECLAAKAQLVTSTVGKEG